MRYGEFNWDMSRAEVRLGISYHRMITSKRVGTLSEQAYRFVLRPHTYPNYCGQSRRAARGAQPRLGSSTDMFGNRRTRARSNCLGLTRSLQRCHTE